MPSSFIYIERDFSGSGFCCKISLHCRSRIDSQAFFIMGSPVFSKASGQLIVWNCRCSVLCVWKMEETVFSKEYGEVAVGVHPAVRAWLGGVHKHGGVYSHNDISNQTHWKHNKPLRCMLQQLVRCFNKKLCTNLNEGHLLQPQFSAHVCTVSLIPVCTTSQYYLPNPCVDQCAPSE